MSGIDNCPCHFCGYRHPGNRACGPRQFQRARNNGGGDGDAGPNPPVSNPAGRNPCGPNQPGPNPPATNPPVPGPNQPGPNPPAPGPNQPGPPPPAPGPNQPGPPPPAPGPPPPAPGPYIPGPNPAAPNPPGPNIPDACPIQSFCYCVAVFAMACMFFYGFIKNDCEPGNCSPINENMKRMFTQSGCTACKGASIPPHLQKQLDEFKAAVNNKHCRPYGESCAGLTNYAGYGAGATLMSIGSTRTILNPANCRCHDKDTPGLCGPNQPPCKNCRCDVIEPDIVLREHEVISPGRCWAFEGQGEIHIRMFYPIIVIGVTIHHAPKKQLIPGSYISAPKDFEIYGLPESGTGGSAEADGKKKTKPSTEVAKLGSSLSNHVLLGKFEFKSSSESSQIFAIQDINPAKFRDVKLHILSNHGHPNYTSLYRVEVHGLLDNQNSEEESC